ncbi:hypothetical protein PF011_g4806 [Phytophthora fragariae]|uniref:Uncharacterized protein n=1 Tax=Phytophthora fragariae TaxID=53985 RepID=A0A6A3LQY2_9STRA|nr:hypothetical protein PF003_g3248 [Phytophthora fragariae]KAE9021702.1 hypothetical protein PF011_g4806 [Phytophthora fragariae]
MASYRGAWTLAAVAIARRSGYSAQRHYCQVKLEAACTSKSLFLTLRCPELEERLASYVEACAMPAPPTQRERVQLSELLI